MDRKQLEAMNEESLDEMVINLKLYEATDINNRGKEAQIEYILGCLPHDC